MFDLEDPIYDLFYTSPARLLCLLCTNCVEIRRTLFVPDAPGPLTPLHVLTGRSLACCCRTSTLCCSVTLSPPARAKSNMSLKRSGRPPGIGLLGTPRQSCTSARPWRRARRLRCLIQAEQSLTTIPRRYRAHRAMGRSQMDRRPLGGRGGRCVYRVRSRLLSASTRSRDARRATSVYHAPCACHATKCDEGPPLLPCGVISRSHSSPTERTVALVRSVSMGVIREKYISCRLTRAARRDARCPTSRGRSAHARAARVHALRTCLMSNARCDLEPIRHEEQVRVDGTTAAPITQDVPVRRARPAVRRVLPRAAKPRAGSPCPRSRGNREPEVS
jgi:hypothetical protein